METSSTAHTHRLTQPLRQEEPLLLPEHLSAQHLCFNVVQLRPRALPRLSPQTQPHISRPAWAVKHACHQSLATLEQHTARRRCNPHFLLSWSREEHIPGQA